MLAFMYDFFSMLAGLVVACAAGLALAGGVVLLKLLGLLVFVLMGGWYFCSWLWSWAAGWLGA